jgi:hypothetical protein
VYAITRDTLQNFDANVAADSWNLQNPTGGIVAGDLVPAVNGKSAVYTARKVGSAAIRATSSSLTTVTSGTITVVPGSPKKVRVETTADGSGVVVPAGILGIGSSLTVFSNSRDSLDNFVANIAANSWSLQNITGSVVAGDLVPVAGNKSAVLSGHAAGSATILATSGTLTPIGSGTITISFVQGVADGTRPFVYALEQNYPNPFNPSTRIRYQLPGASDVTLVVFDMLGRQVAALVDSRQEAGVHEVTFDGSNLASGAYFYRLQAGTFVQMKKLLLLR